MAWQMPKIGFFPFHVLECFPMAHGDEFLMYKKILRFRQLIVAVPALLFAISFWFSGAKTDMHMDEYTTWNLGRLTWGEFWVDRVSNGHLPLWFLTSVLTRPLTGDTEFGLRIPAGLAWGLTLLLPLLLSRAGLPVRVVSYLTGFLALNAVALWAGLNARPSAFLLLGGAMVFVFGEIFRNRPSKFALGAVGLGSFIAMGSGAGYIGAALGYGLYHWFSQASRAIRRQLVIAIALGPLLWLPAMAIVTTGQQKYEDRTWSFQTLNPDRLIAPLGNVAAGMETWGMRSGIGLLFVAAMITGARRHRVGAAGAAMFGGVWATLALTQIYTGHSVLGAPRYFSPALLAGFTAAIIGAFAWSQYLRTACLRLPKPVRFLRATVFTLAGILVLTGLGANSREFALRTRDGVKPMTQDILRRAEAPFPWVLPKGPHFEYEFLKSGKEDAMDRYAEALLIPRGRDKETSAAVNKTIASFWEQKQTFFLVVYNSKTDPLDWILQEPPTGWTLSEVRRHGDTRMALVMPLGEGWEEAEAVEQERIASMTRGQSQ
jgi:hypothetical protein